MTYINKDFVDLMDEIIDATENISDYESIYLEASTRFLNSKYGEYADCYVYNQLDEGFLKEGNHILTLFEIIEFGCRTNRFHRLTRLFLFYNSEFVLCNQKEFDKIYKEGVKKNPAWKNHYTTYGNLQSKT